TPMKGDEACGGVGPNGLLVCPLFQEDAEPGEWIIVSQIFDTELPLADPENFYQYGFVFDSNNTTSDNWTTLPQFRNDYFQGSDRWYEVTYTPKTGWMLNVLVVTDPATNSTEHDNSAAFALIDGN